MSAALLSDAQIERFARQIVLPEVGGRGQERLLASCVALRASSGADSARDVLLLCALHLGVAGVGALVVPDGFREAATTALAVRNPDVVLTSAPRASDAVVAIGDESDLLDTPPTAFGGAGATALVVARPSGRCLACLRTALPPLVSPGVWPSSLAPLLASLLATVTLGELLRLDPHEEPKLLTVGIGDAGAASLGIPARPGCRDC